MRQRNWAAWRGALLLGLIAGGCRGEGADLTDLNFRQKFDLAEEAYRLRPGEMRPGDFEAILGPGEAITAGQPDLADLPPGMIDPNLRWSRWARGNEQLYVGFAGNLASTVSRMRR